MLKKKMMALGIAVVFTLSSLTTTVLAADYRRPSTGTNVTIKVASPGKGNAYGKTKDKKNDVKKYKFDDCMDIDWALNAIEKLAGKGIIGGYGKGQFGPRNNVTHVEALAMVMRLTGDDDEAENKKNQRHPYYKGLSSSWGMGYIFVAIEKGILLPEELRDFNPTKPAKRHEIAKYIIRAMGETEEALDHMDEKLSFKDRNAVPDESVGYVYLVNELEIMIGDDNNNFKPMEPVTRAQMAVLLDRAEGKFDLPDTDNRKNNTVFVSADTDDNEITVTVKGTKVTYDVLEDVNVYRDGSFESLEDLVKGDVIQLTLNDDKEVIFIEVVKEADEDDDDDDDVSVVEGEIYGISSSSKTIRIEKANGSKVSYTIPSGAEIIVNDDDDAEFSDLEVGMNVEIEITDDEVTKVTAEDDEAEEVSFRSVDYSDLSAKLKDQVDHLKLTENYKAFEYNEYIYLIATMGKKTSDDYEIDITNVNSIKNGSKYTVEAEVEIDSPSSSNDDDTVYPYSIIRFKHFDDIDTVRFVDEDNDELDEVKIVEIDKEVEVAGTINSINASRKTIDVKKSNGSTVTLKIPTDAEITVNDDEDGSFSDLVKGMSVEVLIIDEIVTEVIAEDKLAEVTGKLMGISISTVKKITLKVGTTNKTYTVDSDVKVIIDGETERVEDLRVNDELTLKFTNGLLTEIEKE